MFFKTYGDAYSVKFCSQEIIINIPDSHGAALQAACILLEQGNLKNFSQKPHLEINVIGTHETVVYNVWKESYPESSMSVPRIERTTVNSTWFDYNTVHADAEVNSEDKDNDKENISENFSPVFIKPLNDKVMAALQELPTPLSNAKQLEPLLKPDFGHPYFQLKQEEAIDSCLKNNNTFVVMPTGGGKSIIYLLTAIAQPGISIVISPLLSLIEDQMLRCSSIGISSAALLGEMPESEKQNVYSTLKEPLCQLKILYTTPETLMSDRVLRSILNYLHSLSGIQRFVVDEAHCAVEWGYEFRPAYASLKLLRSDFPEIPLLMLTATATEAVINETIQMLGLKDVNIIKSDFSRCNLFCSVEQKTST